MLLSEILESLGDELQYTVLAYVTPYVIVPTSFTNTTTYMFIAGTVLMCQLITAQLWTWICQRMGKWRGYVIYNFTLSVVCILKVFVTKEDDISLPGILVISALWGIGLGGTQHLYRSLLADGACVSEVVVLPMILLMFLFVR